MKKILTLITSVVVGSAAMAQGFFEYTNYAGAFAPAPTARWTDGWTNFDPQNATYPSTTVSIPAGDITTNTTWTSGNTYLLDGGFVYVTNGATLTIEAGTIIRGTGNGTLIIEKGAKINAQGTANNPIIFTSNQPAGSRDYGDWGGVVLLGQATNNNPNSPNVVTEGGIGNGTTGKGCFGGTNDNDNSGIMSYVRIEFCGIPLVPNSEINGLTFGAVGAGTQIDHIQVSYSGDDSFEWFGGTVDCKYLVAFHGWDDDFDTDFGYRGRIQFGFSVRDSRIADQSGSNGFESDNDAAGTNLTPKTKAKFSNITIIGPNWTGNADTTNSLYKRGAHIRRNSSISIYNSIITGYPSAGFLIDAVSTANNYCGDTLQLCGNILAQIKGSKFFQTTAGADTSSCSLSNSVFQTMGLADNNDTLSTTTSLLLGPTFGNSLADYDARPQTGSPAINHTCWSWNTEFMGVEETEIEGFNVYPNPASNMINVSFTANASSNATITMIDLTGKVVRVVSAYQVNNGANIVTFDVSNLSTGIYMLNIQAGAFNKVAKVVIQ